MSDEHVYAIDVSCSCGWRLNGAWSPEEVAAEIDAHERRMVEAAELERLAYGAEGVTA